MIAHCREKAEKELLILNRCTHEKALGRAIGRPNEKPQREKSEINGGAAEGYS